MIVLPICCVGYGLHCAQLQVTGGGAFAVPQPPGRGIVLSTVPGVAEFRELVCNSRPKLVVVPELSAYSHLAAAAWSTEVPVVSCSQVETLPGDAWVLLDSDAETLSVAETDAERESFERMVGTARSLDPSPASRRSHSLSILSEAHTAHDVFGAVDAGATDFGVIKPESLFSEAYLSSGGRTEFADVVRRREFFDPPRVRFFDGEEVARSGTARGFGCRGVRLLAADPEQVRVFQRGIELLGVPDTVVVLPMVACAEEVRAAAQMLGLGRHQLGVTVETPAAVLAIEDIAEQISFVEIGVNDLTQFTMAWDRNVANDCLLPRARIADPVIRQVASVVAACRRTGVYCTIGMDLKPNVRIATQLIECELQSVSCAPSLVGKWIEAFETALQLKSLGKQ